VPFTSNLTRTLCPSLLGVISMIVPVTFDFCVVNRSPTLYVAVATDMFFSFLFRGFGYVLSVTFLGRNVKSLLTGLYHSKTA